MMMTMFIKMLVLMTLAQGGNSSSAPCVNDTQPRSTTYWTDWHSSNSSLTDAGERENFTQVCSTIIIATECREKYTHRGLAETGLSFTTPCEDGALLCENQGPNSGAAQNCVDMEMRLKCTTPDDALREPDFQWSLSELDTGNTREAPEPWTCSGGTLVQEVAPIIGDLHGIVVDGDGLDRKYGVSVQITRCAVKTKGLASLSFVPFVRSCLTDPDCCNPAGGITVSFWFFKSEKNKNEDIRPQMVPLHVFRSPYLLITMQEGYLTVTYHHGAETSTVRAEMVESSWRLVTVTYDPDTDVIKIYRNKEDVSETVSNSAQGAWSSLAEFEAANASFQVFSTEGSTGVTSSDIRPISITNLRIFYAALSAEDVTRMFVREQNSDLPAKVIRMSTSRKQFLDFLTQADVAHVRLQCLIRVHRDAPLIVHFMYTNDVRNEPFQEMTSDVFEMRTYQKVGSDYRHTAVVQILGRHDGLALPLYYTCDVVSLSHISGYGYEIIGIHVTTEIVESTHYWTKFFDSGPPNNDGEEDESIQTHAALADAEHYELLCDDPVYAECRAKTMAKTTPSSNDSVTWYDATPPFVPDYDYPCDKNGIRCFPQDADGTNQACPDLQVRYACLKPTTAQPTDASGGGDPGVDPNPSSGNNSQPNPTSDISNTSQAEPGSNPPQPSNATAQPTDESGGGDPGVDPNPSSGNNGQPNPTSDISNTSQAEPGSNPQQPSNDDSLTNGPVTTPSTEGQQSETKGNAGNSFQKAITDNLNWIYPLMIGVLGAGIPTMISCYFLCRKKTPEELEAQRLVVEKLREAANRPMSVKGRQR